MAAGTTATDPVSQTPAPANASAPLPLEGVRILDFTQVMMGPCCTQMLGDYGADVIKIERSGMGDLSRWSVGEDPDGGNNPVFASLNRNKRSLALDLKRETDRDIVRRLVENADVVVNNFRPGVMERMGFGYEELKGINPRIIWAMGSGYGPDGPYVRRGKGGQDVLAQAMTGAMHRRSGPEVPLSVYPTALADYAAGMHLVQGILLALLQRERTGEGQRISVSLYNSMLAMQMQEAAMHLMRGRELNWAAYPLSGVFETTDGAIVMVGAFKENPAPRDLLRARFRRPVGGPEIREPRAADGSTARELQAIFREKFASGTTAHWVERLEAVDILCAPVKSLEEALADPQTAFNRMIVESEPTAAGTGPPRRLADRDVGRSVRNPASTPEAGRAPRRGARGDGGAEPNEEPAA